MMQDIVVGLDIGTTKVCALVVAPDSTRSSLNILGVGVAPSDGLRKGVVVNIDKTVRSISQAVEQAQQQSGLQLQDVFVGIAGDHIQSFASRSIIAIPDPNREISQNDVSRLIDDTRRIAIPTDRKILHIVPQEYIIDSQDGITDPIGMSGVRMEAKVHVVTAMSTAINNIHRVVERAGLSVREVILEPLASSMAVLDQDEKEVGVALVDIGGGTTDIAVFEEGIIRHSAVIGIAGHQVSEDIAKSIGILKDQAEFIKREYGHALKETILRDEIFMIPGISGRKPLEVSKSLLCEIIEARMEEIFEMVYNELRSSGFLHRLHAGLVITGGASMLRGTAELAAKITGMPVKLGVPSGVQYGGLSREVESPTFSTAVGLVLHGLNAPRKPMPQPAIEEPEEQEPQSEQEQISTSNQHRKPGILERFKNFFEDL